MKKARIVSIEGALELRKVEEKKQVATRREQAALRAQEQEVRSKMERLLATLSFEERIALNFLLKGGE